jgi:hypothetical protein
MDDIEGTIVVWHMVIDEPIDVGLGPEPPVSEYCSFCGNMFSDNIYETSQGRTRVIQFVVNSKLTTILLY